MWTNFSLVFSFASFSSGPPKLVILHMGLAIHTFDDIMRVTENLNAKYIVGYGASGTVYKCALKNSRPIAIKRPYNQHPHNSREFETELETIGSIRHRNLVTLHGYALTPNGNLLFYDYMENGSLWDLLHGNIHSPWNNSLEFFNVIWNLVFNNKKKIVEGASKLESFSD